MQRTASYPLGYRGIVFFSFITVIVQQSKAHILRRFPKIGRKVIEYSYVSGQCRQTILFCQPRVEVTSCFVYKVMGLTFHDRIKSQSIYRFELAQVVARRITKPQRICLGTNLTGCFFYSVFFIIIFGEGGGGGLNSYSRILPNLL